MKNCNECGWINMTEQQQIDKRKDHICLKHKVRLLHRSNSPKIEHNFIYPCEQCNSKDFKESIIITIKINMQVTNSNPAF